MLNRLKSFKFIYSLLIIIFISLSLYLIIKLFPFYGSVFSFIIKLLSPFIVASFLAYLLYPLINKLDDYNIGKTFAILFIYFVFFGGTAFLIYRAYPAILNQLKDLNEHIPELIAMYEEMIMNIYDSTSFLPEAVHEQIDQMIINIENRLEKVVAKLMNKFIKIFDLVIFITIIPVLVFYFLKDYEKIKNALKIIIPKRHHFQIKKLLLAIDDRLGSYIRGQLLVSFFVSLASLLAFHFLNIKYPLLLAIIMGLTNMIPYFGPIIGSVPVIAITITVSTKLVFVVILAILVIQIIESNFLSPYIVGRSTNIHPVTIIFVLLLGGKLFGVIGMLLAVPILTIIKEIVIHFVELNSVN